MYGDFVWFFEPLNGDLIFNFASEWTANFSPLIFPSFSDSSSRKTLEFICTGWRRWGAWKGMFVEKSGISQLFMIVVFIIYLPFFLAFGSSQESSSYYWHIIFISFLSASFWKMLIANLPLKFMLGFQFSSVSCYIIWKWIWDITRLFSEWKHRRKSKDFSFWFRFEFVI